MNNKKFKNKKIEFAPQDKVTEMAYQLVKDLFTLEDGVLLSNESLLNDFYIGPDGIGAFPEESKFRKSVFKQIKSSYGVSMDEYPLDKSLYVWEVAEFICRKLKDRWNNKR